MSGDSGCCALCVIYYLNIKTEVRISQLKNTPFTEKRNSRYTQLVDQLTLHACMSRYTLQIVCIFRRVFCASFLTHRSFSKYRTTERDIFNDFNVSGDEMNKEKYKRKRLTQQRRQDIEVDTKMPTFQLNRLLAFPVCCF
jgi:hypothetical protein